MSSILFTNTYSDTAWDFILFAFYAYNKNYRTTKWAELARYDFYFERKSNGEIILHKDRIHPYTRTARTMINRIDCKDIAKAIKDVIENNYNDGIDWGKDKEFELTADQKKYTWMGFHLDRSKHLLNKKLNFLDAKILYDFFMGATINFLKTTYGNEKIENVIGSPRNPFDTAKEELRKEEETKIITDRNIEIAKIKSDFEVEYKKMIAQRDAKIKEAESKYDIKIKELNESFKKMTA